MSNKIENKDKGTKNKVSILQLHDLVKVCFTMIFQSNLVVQLFSIALFPSLRR